MSHYLAGRAVGNQFRFYRIRGTDHPKDYQPGIHRDCAGKLPSPARRSWCWFTGYPVPIPWAPSARLRSPGM